MDCSGCSYTKAFWLLFAICLLTMLPFIGLSDFHTKGEPREAIVAYSMLEQGNWILPQNNGGDIPYKPPFFHWCIAAIALLFNGGIVNEAISRLPSVIALVAMIMTCFSFFAKRTDTLTAAISALIAFTSFELHRAGMNCRVDMMMTALIVMSLICFYRWYEKGLRGLPWAAILFMSCAALTKGPVGIILPCLTTGIFLLCKGTNIFKAAALLMICAVLSTLLPAIWYIAAYHQGGKEFLDLVMEENFGRFTGTMKYDSHVNPWYYNLTTIIAGYVPWTLCAVISLFTLHYRAFGKPSLERLSSSFRNMSPVNLFSFIAIMAIFIFYCIPESKRSVYLMPVYPFIAYFFALYLLYLIRNGSRAIKIYGGILATVAILLPVALIIAKSGLIPDTMFKGRHAALNIAMLHNIADIGGAFSIMIISLTTLTGIGWYVYCRKKLNDRHIFAIIAVTLGLYISLDGVYQPAVLNAKSMKGIVAEIERNAPESEGKLYEFIAEGVFSTGNPVHFFEPNFYLGNRTGNFYKTRPDSGFLMINDYDAEKYLPEFKTEGYDFTPVYKSSQTSKIHSSIEVYRFNKTNAAVK